MSATLPAAVLFDLDGTLVDGERLWAIAHRRTARALGGDLDDTTRTALVGADIDTSVALLLTAVGRRGTPQLVENTRGRLLSTVAALYTDGVDWMPGARAALDTVRRTGRPAALVTNTPRALTDRVLAGIGRHHFEVTVCADECLAGKPEPDPYLQAAELLGVPIEECLVIEDSPDGVLSAERADAVVLAVPDRVPVPSGLRRTHRTSLVGLTVTDLATAFAAVRRPVPVPTFVDVMSESARQAIRRRNAG